jgi:hypothetical protein
MAKKPSRFMRRADSGVKFVYDKIMPSLQELRTAEGLPASCGFAVLVTSFDCPNQIVVEIYDRFKRGDSFEGINTFLQEQGESLIWLTLSPPTLYEALLYVYRRGENDWSGYHTNRQDATLIHITHVRKKGTG